MPACIIAHQSYQMLELAMKHMLILLLASFQCCTVLAFFSKKSSKWTVVSKQSSSSAGSATQPSVRYGHKCLPYEGNIICSHGYFFDRDSGVATWKSDSWAMQTQKPFHWSLLTKQLSQEHSHSQYSSGRIPHQPCGRFGFGLAAVNETLYLYGGHDGGISR